jgi:hypothetical protein
VAVAAIAGAAGYAAAIGMFPIIRYVRTRVQGRTCCCVVPISPGVLHPPAGGVEVERLLVLHLMVRLLRVVERGPRWLDI